MAGNYLDLLQLVPGIVYNRQQDASLGWCGAILGETWWQRRLHV